jgi:hypothetical protein
MSVPTNQHSWLHSLPKPRRTKVYGSATQRFDGFYGRLPSRRWRYGYYRAGKYRGPKRWPVRLMIRIAEGRMTAEEASTLADFVPRRMNNRRRRQMAAEIYLLAEWTGTPVRDAAEASLKMMERWNATER